MTLSPEETNLELLAAQSRLDGTLQALAGLASAGATYVLGILINGMTVYGRTTAPRDIGEVLDAENDRMIERARNNGGTAWDDDAVRRIHGAWTREFENDEETKRQLAARNEGKDLQEISDDDLREAIEDRATVLTLADVQICPPGGLPTNVPVLRVRIAAVDGWWVVPTDVHGRAIVSHPSTTSAANGNGHGAPAATAN